MKIIMYSFQGIHIFYFLIKELRVFYRKQNLGIFQKDVIKFIKNLSTYIKVDKSKTALLVLITLHFSWIFVIYVIYICYFKT